MIKKKTGLALFLGLVLAMTPVGCGKSETVSIPDTRSTGQEETTGKKGAKKQTESQSESRTESQAENQAGNQTDNDREETTAGQESLEEQAVKDRENEFYISEITDEIFERMEGKSYKADATIAREDLRYLHVLHKDIRGQTHQGEMVVNRHIAQDVLDILRELYEEDYPIEKIRLVDEYDADDEKSMEDNNSSSFNFRFISHTRKVSKHGLGLAVDINTLYNPYTKVVDGERIVEPVTGEPYLDRDESFDYKIEKGDLCYKLFTEHGFEWGGEWTDRKDYQHFEIPDDQIQDWYPDNEIH